MSVSPLLLFVLCLLYLGLLFLVAKATDTGLISPRVSRHPLVYTLSLGVFVSIWGFYGVVRFTAESGFNFLTYYLGPAGALLLAPFFLRPLRELTHQHQLYSLADLLSYRFRSQAVGTLATLVMLLGVMPLLATQMQTLGVVLERLTGHEHLSWAGLILCLALIAFVMRFGARHEARRDSTHHGLIAAIALTSLIKLVAMAGLILLALYTAFGDLSGLQSWLAQHPEALDVVFQPLQDGYWHSLLLVFFLAAVVMPFMYQVTVTESAEPRHLNTASWGLPLYLLLMAAGVPVLLWAGMALDLPGDPAYISLDIVALARAPGIALLLFMGSVSAVSGLLIMSTLALANMTVNHVVLPLRGLPADDAVYAQTLRLRRVLIVCIPLAAFALAAFPAQLPDSTEMSMLAFVAVLQLAPGLLGLLFWPRATASGTLAGLLFGMLFWLLALVLPAVFQVAPATHWLPMNLPENLDHWHAMGLISVLGNVVLLVGVSLLARQDASDLALAESCSIESARQPLRGRLNVADVDAVIAALTPVLGPATATREVRQACQALGLSRQERRPYALRRLRDQLGSNLSGLLGPNLAQEILDLHLPQQAVGTGPADDIQYLEAHLESYRDRLSGLAAELDLLRRFHRQTLHDLPLGVCTLAGDGEVISWNRAMMTITGLAEDRVVGARPDRLPSPWCELLGEFLSQPAATQRRQPVALDGQTRWISLHRAVIGDDRGSQVLVMDDVTALARLETSLQHAERLAAIGRLAAGVAHEIGNPVTGIASLAQNLQAEYADDEVVRETARDILTQTRRVSRIVQSLVGFSRADQHSHGVFEKVSLQIVVDEAIHLLRLVPDRRGVRFENTLDATLHARGDPQRLCQLFVNLLSNARDASTAEGRVVIRGTRNADQLRLAIEDFGHGLPGSLSHDQLFEPFVSTKPAGEGTGLGLALVHGIVEAHHGQVQLMDKRDYDQGTGVIVQLTLPAWCPTPTDDPEEPDA